MPQIIHGPKQKTKVDGSVKSAAYSFLEKLQESHSTVGLHVEPINGSADPRVRTARVTEFWRAVLVQVDDAGNHYVYLGVYPHDDAIAFAKKVQLKINPRNGIAELVDADKAAKAQPAAPIAAPAPVAKPKPEDVDTTAYPLLQTQGIGLDELVGLGIDADLATHALAITDQDRLMALVEHAPTWQGLAVIDLAFGKGLDAVRESLQIPAAARDDSADDTDEALLAALQHPAARAEFAFIEGQEELREVIENDDFGAWRVFLHPEQRQYAERQRNGSFRLSGGAGTGKTVVLLHRARFLARQNPEARIVLTTYNRTLAASLLDQLRVLDPTISLAVGLGQPGVHVAGVDQLARGVLSRAGVQLGSTELSDGPVTAVLGHRTPQVLDLTPASAWDAAISSVGEALPPELRSPVFMQAEYATVVLPTRITTREEYLKVRRPGRRVALDRSRRNAVWAVVEAYRSAAAATGSTDFEEKTMIAAVQLDGRAGIDGARIADHVLVDEAQDLSPARLLFLRALVETGPNDLFLAEDSHQRIYGQRIVLSKYGINIVGRSRRLTLNYRTTHETLSFAVQVLGDESFADLEADEAAKKGYRAARTGPAPRTVSCSSLGGEYEKAAEIVKEWLGSEDSPETIGVLVFTKWEGESLQRALSERGVDARFVGSEGDIAPGKVVIMTMHRSKGMEFKRVALFGVGAESGPAAMHLDQLPEPDRVDALLRDRSLLYVAATRARDELVVLWKGERSELLPA